MYAKGLKNLKHLHPTSHYLLRKRVPHALYVCVYVCVWYDSGNYLIVLIRPVKSWSPVSVNRPNWPAGLVYTRAGKTGVI